jgi:hypothetical protein
VSNSACKKQINNPAKEPHVLQIAQVLMRREKPKLSIKNVDYSQFCATEGDSEKDANALMDLGSP